MHRTQAVPSHQHNRIDHYKKTCDSHSMFNSLTSHDLLNKVEELLPNHRERLYPPTETLSMFLAQAMSADRSCQNRVNQTAIQRMASGLSLSSTLTGGYCRARKRLPLEMVSELTCYLGDIIRAQSKTSWKWKKRDIKIVDGTTVTMPDTTANQLVYPQQSGQKAGLGFPICRVVGITCLSSGALLNAAVGPFKGKGGDEQTLVRSIQDTLHSGDILMGDAYYASFFFIAAMQAKGVDILMEQYGARRRSTDFRKGRKLGAKDHIIELSKPNKPPYWMSASEYQAVPDSIFIREFKVDGKIMITTMGCPKYASKNELKQLYKSRWHVELDIRHIKTTMGMNTLSCKTPEMVVKEMWVYLLAYNMIRLMMIKSALLTDVPPREISFKHCLQLWISWCQLSSCLELEESETLLILIAQQRTGNRPGRIEPRALKRRAKPYPLLKKHRNLARIEVIENGHP